MNPGKAMFCRSIKYALYKVYRLTLTCEIADAVANVVGMVYSLSVVVVEKSNGKVCAVPEGWVEPTPWLILTSTLATTLALTPPSPTLTPTPTPTPTKVGLAAQPKPSLPCEFLF